MVTDQRYIDYILRYIDRYPQLSPRTKVFELYCFNDAVQVFNELKRPGTAWSHSPGDYDMAINAWADSMCEALSIWAGAEMELERAGR